LGERPVPGGGRRLIDFKGADGPAGVRVLAVAPNGSAARAGLKVDDVITTVNKQKVVKLEQIVNAFRASLPGNKVALKVVRGKETKDLAILVLARTAPRPTRRYAFWYGGQRENVQNQQGPEGEQYGGVFRSEDGGESWVRVNSVNPRPMYFSQI